MFLEDEEFEIVAHRGAIADVALGEGASLAGASVAAAFVRLSLNPHPLTTKGCGTQRPGPLAASKCGLTVGMCIAQPCSEYFRGFGSDK